MVVEPLFTLISEHRGSVRFDEYQTANLGQSLPLEGRGTVWRRPLAIAGSFDDDLAVGVGQAGQDAAAQNVIAKWAELRVQGLVAGSERKTAEHIGSANGIV